MRRAIVLLAVSLCALAVADSWTPPRPTVHASKWGQFGMRVVPGQGSRAFEPATGVLYTLGPNGRERVIWKRKLVNVPHQVAISDSGRVYTVDTYANLGYRHALVVYGDDGRPLADYALEDLLPPSELEKVDTTAGSRWWAGKASFTVTEADTMRTRLAGIDLVRPRREVLHVKLSSGYEFRIDLVTGKKL